MTPRRTEPGDTTQAARRRDRGYTLTELLIAMALMGTVILAILGGMFAVVRASRVSDERAKVQAILGSAGDSLVNYVHVKCPEPEDDQMNTYLGLVQRAADTVGWPPSTVDITAYRFFDPAAGTWDENNSVQGTECNPGVFLTPAKTMQKLTITVTSPSGDTRQSIDIVKVDIRADEIRDASPVDP
jgi:prepilin-type N-terminal cleavage/methylation domain-containing protein